MKALVYHGPEDVRVEERDRPAPAAPGDAVVRVTAAAICGSDLHLYHGDIPDLHEGDILGHEFVGIVDETGPEVGDLRPGDRVVVSGLIACGSCEFCRRELYGLCDTTNPNPVMQELYGASIAGVFGYSHLVGGFDGGQAEYVRVPYADVNCLKVPEGMPDEQAVTLSDTMCTGWHACALGEVSGGKSVAVFGCGPIGLAAMEAARALGAAEIIAVDHLPYRLSLARRRFRAIAVNYDENDPVKTVREITFGRGADVCIETAGFRYARTFRHRIQRKLKLETDAIDALSDAIRSARKAGNVAIIGDFIGFANQFPIGAMMEKGLTVRGGQVHVQRYWKDLLPRMRDGQIDPSFLFTHRVPLERAPEAYRMFDRKQDGVIKVLLRPGTGSEAARQRQAAVAG
ncbi:MAG TPA: zinc-dependent alcohol dehydrogenase [Dehalococcoidia bacterium]|nr:zinc-dependent alcohol dehydrogenase [Dehalococcoidia bacterium]